jgi:hypothetical protein
VRLVVFMLLLLSQTDSSAAKAVVFGVFQRDYFEVFF